MKDSDITGWINQPDLPAGTYRLEVKATFSAEDVNDYTLTVHSPSKVLLTDATGNTNEAGQHDLQGYTPSPKTKTP